MARDSLRWRDQDWSWVLEQMGGADAVDAAAASTGVVKRRRGFADGSQVVRAALLYGAGDSLRSVAAQSEAILARPVSDVAVLGRLRQAGPLLEAVVSRLLERAAGAPLGPAWSGRPIRLVDSSEFSGPGLESNRGRLHLSYDPFAQRVVRLEVTDIQGAESLDRAEVEAGAVLVGDRNYARVLQLAKVAQADAYFLVRGGGSVRMVHPGTDRRVTVEDMREALAEAAQVELAVDLVQAKARAATAVRLPVRLVVVRASEKQVARERARIERSKTKKGWHPKPETWAKAEIIFLITNLPAEEWPAVKLDQLYRLRWQIEIAFKTLKSVFRMRDPPAKDPGLLRTWILANIAAALLAEIIALDLQGAIPP